MERDNLHFGEKAQESFGKQNTLQNSNRAHSTHSHPHPQVPHSLVPFSPSNSNPNPNPNPNLNPIQKKNPENISLSLFGGGGFVRTIQKNPSQSQNKRYSLMGDVYRVMIVPKEELELQSHSHALSLSHINKEFHLELPFRAPNIGEAFQDILRTREAGEFLSGALAGAMTKAILAPLETIRTRMVVGVGSRNIYGSFIQIIEQQGWKGLWAGNAINMIRIVPTQAIELGTFECVKRTMTSIQENWNQNESPQLQIGHVSLSFSLSWLSPVAVAGAAAGIVSTLVCHPLEVLKDRLTVNPDFYPSLSIAVRKIYKDGGIGAFYSGISPTLIGMLPYSTCYYFMYETMKNSYCLAKKKKSLSRAEMLLLGALSGLTASTISYPLEVARKRLMVGALQGKCPPYMAAVLSEVIKKEGLMGLYRGWGASCLKVMPSSGITWMFYEAWKDILLAEKRPL